MNRPPISTPRRDPVRCARGKAIVAGTGDASALSKAEVEDAMYYLDSVLFVGAGLGKGAKLLRAEAKKRGVL
jgi:hypothetical protein